MPLYPSLYNRLENQHQLLEQIIKNVSDQRMQLQPAPGKWSAHDNIAHLARYQEYFVSRIHAILEQDTPAFERYNADNDPDFENWLAKPTTELIESIRSNRQVIFESITGLSEDQLNRIGIHKKFGKLTLVRWAEFFLLHESHHHFSVFKLVQDVDMP